MHKNVIFACFVAVALLVFAPPAKAATFTGTVTDKTTNKPSAGDAVQLVDVQAGMADVASATTDAAGHYSLNGPGMGPYLIRVNHQGATYFIAAPQGGAPGDVTVYDVAAKVDGVAIDADMLLIEAGGGTLRVHERYLIRNTSLPPRAQFSSNTFEVAIPPDAELDGAAATRPGGLGTNTHLTPLAEKGHYTFNVPIQPDQGEKETLFEIQYHLPYSGKYTFSPHLQMAADNLVAYVAKGIDFSNAQGAEFHPTQEDPRVQTFVAKGVHPGQSIRFTVAGEGQMAGGDSGNPMGQQGGIGDSGSAGVMGRPGGGLGAPINSPDPLTKYKWWILAALTLALVAGAGILLRGRTEAIASSVAAIRNQDLNIPEVVKSAARLPRPASSTAPPSSNAGLLNLIKEEMFAIESEKLSGALPLEEYATIKVGLEALLRRVLHKQ